MKYIIYLLINERKNKTYIGYSGNFENRIRQHKTGQVKSTRNFGMLSSLILEKVDSLEIAIKKEKYWKSAAGRKKIRSIMPPSSNG